MFEYFEPPPEFLSRQRLQIFLTIVCLKKSAPTAVKKLRILTDPTADRERAEND
jgi:hypothetical protein